MIDRPFPDTREMIAGFWLIQVKSKEEAIEWMKRSPNPFGAEGKSEIEIRQVYELEDFPPEVRVAAAGEEGVRAEVEQRWGA